ncbi:MAG: hypothetical protein ABIB79_01335 [archaeon]
MTRGPTHKTNYLERIKIYYDFVKENLGEMQKSLDKMRGEKDISSDRISSLEIKIKHYREFAREYSEDFPEVLEED